MKCVIKVLRQFLRYSACLLVLLSAPCFCFAQDANPQEGLTDKYLSIRDKLIDLKVNSEIVTEQLKTALENLEISQSEAKQWEQTSTQLSESLMNINEQYNDCFNQLVKEQTKNSHLTKVLFTLIIIFAIMIIVKIVFMILYMKGIKIPRIVDILA